MAKWITVTSVPFDYRWPLATAITAFTEKGEFYVKDDVADFAVSKGFARLGKAKGSRARSTKGKTDAAKVAKVPSNAAPTTTDTGPDDKLDGAGLAVDDRLDTGAVVDSDAEQR